MAKLSLFLAASASASALLFAPMVAHAQQYARGGSRLQGFSGGGGAGRSAAVASASGARGYSGFRGGGSRGGGDRRFYGNSGRFNRSGGYYARSTRYYHRGSYYRYDPFFFGGGFGYPSYYYGSGYGLGFGAPFGGYYDGGGYYGAGPGYRDQVYNGRIVDESAPGRTTRRSRSGDDNDDNNGNGGNYSPGSMASAVQRELKERGYYRGGIDGQFGEGSSSALRAFQRDKGLSVNGRLDERTLKALGFEQR